MNEAGWNFRADSGKTQTAESALVYVWVAEQFLKDDEVDEGVTQTIREKKKKADTQLSQHYLNAFFLKFPLML